MSFLSGGGGQNSTSSSFSYSTPHFYTPYQNFADQSLTNATSLRDAAFKPYDVSKMFAPFQPFQQQAFGQIGDLQGQTQPYFSTASGVLNNYTGANPITAAQPFFSAASGTPTAQSVAQPYFSTAGQTWPGASSSYLNPYINDAIGGANKLLTKNFVENTLPGINNQFIASGGGAGGYNPAYNKSMDWALTNFNQNLDQTTQQALANAYNSSASIFSNDAARAAGLAGTAGNLALGQQGTYGNLGTAAGGNAATGINSGATLAGAFGNLGNTQLNNQLTATNALLQAGNQQQQQAQAPLSAEYQQYQQGVQWPYQTNQWAANVINSYQWPHAYSQNNTTNTTSSGSSSNSGLGSLLGGLATIGSLAIPGAGGASAIGNIMSGIGGFFGGGSGGQQYGPPSPFRKGGTVHDDAVADERLITKAVHQHERALHRGSPLTSLKYARGGFFGGPAPSMPPTVTNPAYFKWMEPTAFKAGGMAPVIKAGRRDIRRNIDAARAEAAKPMFGGVTKSLAFAGA